MKKSFLYFCLLLVISFVFSSCHSDRSRILVSAYSMVDSLPDSTLALLRKVDCDNLSAKDMAEYSLLFTMAQDKSGLDVDNDSLIRIAYDWFQQHQDDSLYAKCLYYMGKYYMLNDSTEQAISLLTQSSQKSNKIGDLKTESMALEKLSKVYQVVEPKKSLVFSKKAIHVYTKCNDATLKNMIYLKLNYSDALAIYGNTQLACQIAKEALQNALLLKDSFVLADTYQDLANSYIDLSQLDSGLICAKKAYALQPINNFSCTLALADAYFAADSVRQTISLLSNTRATRAMDKYVSFQLLSKAALKDENWTVADCYMDSAYYYIEEMYRNALQEKSNYYASSLLKEKDKSELKGKKEMQKWVFLLVLLLILVVLAFVIYAYINFKVKAQRRLATEKERIKHKQEMFEKEKELSETFYRKEMSRKEVQFSVLRNYLLKLVSVFDKLNTIKGETGRHVILSDKDWTEIRVFLDITENMFVTRLSTQYPCLSNKDLHLMMLLRLKLPQKALASIYGISEKAIKQKLFLYKEKVGIKGKNQSLREFIETF